jgi:uncharacterized protein YhfF
MLARLAAMITLTAGSALAGASIAYLPDGPARPSPAALDAFWSDAQAAVPGLGDDYEVRWFGIDAKTTDGIFNHIRTDNKHGTFTLPWLLEKTGQPVTKVGTLITLIAYDGRPTMVLRITGNETVPFGAIDERITGLDGPPVRDVKVWKPVHRDFWNGELKKHGLAVSDDMPVLVERFALVYPKP